MQPLIKAACTGYPNPALVLFALEGNLFAQGIDTLFLFYVVDVDRQEVLIQIHTVGQVLISCHGIHDETVALIFYVQPSVEQSAAVTAVTVIADFSDMFFVFFFTFIQGSRIVIRIAAFIAIVVTNRKVQF